MWPSGWIRPTLTMNQSISSDSSQVDNTHKKKTLKRKNREVWVEKAIQNMTDKIIKASEESDRKLIEFEEKRIKFEQKEKECNKRIRKEEGEFQLKLFSMMYS